MEIAYIDDGRVDVGRRIAEVLISEGHNVVIVGGGGEIIGLRDRINHLEDLVEPMVLALDVMRDLDECWLCSDLFFAFCSLFFMGRHDRPPLGHSRPDWDWPALWVHGSQSI